LPTEERVATALFVHGAGGGGWEWNVWTRCFAAVGLAATRIEDYLEQVVAAAARLAAPRVLVGASLGGLLALMAAARVAVDALVMVNPLPASPWHRDLPSRPAWPDVVPWGRTASLPGTRRALPDADETTCLFAFRRWRDESGAALNAAHGGIEMPAPNCPLLMLASTGDEEVPASLTAAWAKALGASMRRVDGSHCGPLLGREAARSATLAVEWLNASGGFSRT
jgi:pimeloyl-ACP methyl ester carboxylesterase